MQKAIVVIATGAVIGLASGAEIEIVGEGYFVDGETTYLHDLHAVEIIEAEGVEVGMVRIPNGTFDFPPALVVAEPKGLADERRQTKIEQANRLCDGFLAALKAGYPEGEVQSWPQQVAEAEKLAANSGAPTPLLSALADRRGVPLEALATKVQEKANAFAAASGAIIGHRQRLEDALHAAKALAEVDAVDVNTGWLAIG